MIQLKVIRNIGLAIFERKLFKRNVTEIFWLKRFVVIIKVMNCGMNFSRSSW